MSNNRISQFQPLTTSAGESWLEVIHRLTPTAPWSHKRISLQALKGKSAYELAVAHGFTGTEEEWLASLVPSFAELGVGLVTASRLPVDTRGWAELPSRPYGGIFLNLGQVFLIDGSFIEVDEVTVTEEHGRYYACLAPSDYQTLRDILQGLTVSYLGQLA